MKQNIFSKFKKKCVVIGTTRLCISILEQLENSSWDVICVISKDIAVKQYCKNKKIVLYVSLIIMINKIL